MDKLYWLVSTNAFIGNYDPCNVGVSYPIECSWNSLTTSYSKVWYNCIGNLNEPNILYGDSLDSMLYTEDNFSWYTTRLLTNGGLQVWINSNAKVNAVENASFQSTVQFNRQLGNQVDTFPVWTLDSSVYSSCTMFEYILEGQDAGLSFPVGCV